MAEFRWHAMEKEQPPKGEGSYVLLGKRGGMYIASKVGSFGDDSLYFYVPNRRSSFVYASGIKAWAEIPAYEEGT